MDESPPIQKRAAALSPAKLNLTLDVLRKRADGFHDIHSLMTRIDLYDSLEMESHQGESITITVDDRRRNHGIDPLDPIPTGKNNLVFKALRELQRTADITTGCHVHLTKRIPSQAGLGGGSSNAATALLLANKIWGLGWTNDTLKSVGKKIGSDVSFFLAPSPSICEGLGNETATFSDFNVRPNFVLLVPPFGLATADVFGRYLPSRPQRFKSSLININCLHRLGKQLRNDLQVAAKELTPRIGEMEELFKQFDLLGHQMTGSGTTYFGICRNAAQARSVAGKLRNRYRGSVFVARSLPTSIASLSF